MSSISDYPYQRVYTYHNCYPYNSQYIAGKDNHRLYNRNTVIENGTMTLNGIGTIKVQPDIAIIVLGAITENIELREAQRDNAERIRNIIDSLVRIGVDVRDIETESYSIVPQYDYVEGTQVFRGYRVTNNLKITVRDIERIGEIIDTAVASGANIVYRVNFTISDPAAYYRRALSQAIMDAVNKALTVEQTLNIKVDTTPNSIQEETIGMGMIAERDELFAPIAATPILTGQIEITARIKAVFAYQKLS